METYLLPLVRASLPSHLVEAGSWGGRDDEMAIWVGGDLLGLLKNAPTWVDDQRLHLEMGDCQLRIFPPLKTRLTDGRLTVADEEALRCLLAKIPAPALELDATALRQFAKDTGSALRALPCVLLGTIDGHSDQSATRMAWDFASRSGLRFPLLSWTINPRGYVHLCVLSKHSTVRCTDWRSPLDEAIAKVGEWLAGKTPMSPADRSEFDLASTGVVPPVFGEISSCQLKRDSCDEWLSSDVVVRLPLLAQTTERVAEKWAEVNWPKIRALLPDKPLVWRTGGESRGEEGVDCPRDGQHFPDPKRAPFSESEVSFSVDNAEATIRISFTERDR